MIDSLPGRQPGFVLLASYLRAAAKLFGDEEQRGIEATLIADRAAGDVMRGTGGVRKLRVPFRRRGKRGGARDVTAVRRKTGRASKRGSSIGEEIIAGLHEAIAYERGNRTGAVFKRAPISARRVEASPAPTFAASDVVAIRRRLGVSQAVFARLLNVSPATERSWEQGLNTPGGPSSRLLQIATANPEALLAYVRRRARP